MLAAGATKIPFNDPVFLAELNNVVKPAKKHGNRIHFSIPFSQGDVLPVGASAAPSFAP